MLKKNYSIINSSSTISRNNIAKISFRSIQDINSCIVFLFCIALSTSFSKLIFFLKQSSPKSTNCSKSKSSSKRQNILIFNILTLFFLSLFNNNILRCIELSSIFNIFFLLFIVVEIANSKFNILFFKSNLYIYIFLQDI